MIFKDFKKFKSFDKKAQQNVKSIKARMKMTLSQTVNVNFFSVKLST